MKTIKKQSLFRSIPVFRFRVATNIQKHVSFQVQGCYRYLETPQCLGLGLPPVFKRKGFLGFRVATLIQGIKSNPYLEAYQYLGLGLPPVFRSIPLFRFRVATSIQKHPNVQVQGCHQYLEEKEYLGLGLLPQFRVYKSNPYLEAYKYLCLGLLPVFRSIPVFRFRVATSVQKHTSVWIQGCYQYFGYKRNNPCLEAYQYLALGLLAFKETTGLWNDARFWLVQGWMFKKE